MKYLKKHLEEKNLLLAGLVMIAVIGVVYYQHTYGAWQTNVGNATNAIFVVASSTGASYFTVTDNGNVGIGSDDPHATLEVAGTLRLTAKSIEGCSPNTEGMLAYNPDNKHFWGCDGSQWHMLDQ